MFQGTEFPLLEKQMESVEGACGYAISFHDLCGITYFVRELNLPIKLRSHHSEYCAAVKGSPSGQECVRCKYVTNYLARKRKKAFTGICHAGVWDLIYPVFFEKVFLGSIFLGAARQRKHAKADSHTTQYNQLPAAPADIQPLEQQARLVAEVIICCLRSHGISASFLHKLRKQRQKPDVEPMHWLVGETIKLIEAHFNEQLSLSSIGKELKVRPQYLCRLFSRQQGMSVTQFIHLIRVRRSKELLLTGQYNVTEVATRVGFDDPSYFTRVFHKLEGKSPSHFVSSHV